LIGGEDEIGQRGESGEAGGESSCERVVGEIDELERQRRGRGGGGGWCAQVERNNICEEIVTDVEIL
jgi:hypothetical protein